MKIALIHNNPRMRWADTFRAEYLRKELARYGDEADIFDSAHLPEPALYDVIHFLYSGGITKSQGYILANRGKVFTSLASQRTLDCMFDRREDLRRVFSRTLCCICQNRGLLDNLRELTGTDNSAFIPNGVDIDTFARPFVAGFVGAKDSSEHKGLDIARRACEELGIRLIEAHEHDYDHDAMPEFYRDIDVLLIPSKSEGCHNPTLEALAMNKPVISTDVGIAAELDGVTIVDRSVEGFKAAIRKLSGRIQIAGDYSWETITKKYRDVYVWYTRIPKNR